MSNDTMQVVNHKKYIIPSQSTKIVGGSVPKKGELWFVVLRLSTDIKKSRMSSTATADVLK